MPNILEGGAALFDSMLLAPPTPSAMNYMQQTMDNFRGSINATASQFYDAVAPRVAAFDYERMQQMAQAAYRTVTNYWRHDMIQPLTTIGQLQHPPDVMIRWLMAEPTTRALYHQGQCEGYEDRYIDHMPNAIGEEHIDYMLVNDGVFHENAEYGMQATEYFAEALPEYDPDYDRLTFLDQDAILTSWEHLAHQIDLGGDDPTSKWNSEL